MAFPRKRALPKKSEPTVMEAIERRETQVKEVLEFIDGKRTLESLGLALDDLRAFAALREALGSDGLRNLAPLLRSMEPGTAREMEVLLSLGLRADESAALREMGQVLKGAGVPPRDMATYLEVAAGMARLGLPVQAAKGVAGEMERLRRAGVPAERVAGILASYAGRQAGAEEALVEAVRRQGEAEGALAALEKRAEERGREIGSLEGSAEEVLQSLMALRQEVAALRQQKDFLEAEVKGLGRARGAPWAEVLARVRAGLDHLQKEREKGQEALEELRKEAERLREERVQAAARPAEGALPPEAPGTPPVPGARYSRLMQRLQKVAISPTPAAPGAPPPPEPEVREPFDPVLVEAAIREVVEGLASLKGGVDTMVRTRDALEADVRKRESELRAASALWSLLSGRGGVDLRTAAEQLAKAAKEGRHAPVPPEFAERLREAARRLLQAETVPVERFRDAEREVAELRGRLEASVPRARFDALAKECEDLRRQLAEAVPKWRVEAQEHELKFLKKMAFEKGT